MKFAIIALSLAFATSAMADGKLLCKTAPEQYGGGTSILVTQTDFYDAVIQGSQNGGMAHYIRLITPVNVKVEHEGDLTVFSNSEEGTQLAVVATYVEGRFYASAHYKEGTQFPFVAMTCQPQ